jgi:hypothetical protein
MDPDPPAPGLSASPDGLRGVILVWLLLMVTTGLPHLEAALRPPPGRQFIGTFDYDDDFYNYLSYVRQAEDGAFLFRNKLVLADHAPALINLEWWTVGLLSRALGGRPLLAYRLLGMAAAFGLLLAVDRWHQAGGLPSTHRLLALLLVGTGAGAGGFLTHVAKRDPQECLDIQGGLFPFMEVLTNPHFVVGTALLSWSLWLLMTGGRRTWWGILLGAVLGLARPYDFVLLVGARTLAVCCSTPPRGWLRRLWPLAALAPVVLYNGWVFYGNPAFAFYTRIEYLSPPLIDYLWALGPAAAFALTGLATRPGAGLARAVRLHLLAWIGLGVVIIVAPLVRFSTQFLVGLGLPLLALAALGLARWPRAWTGAATLLLAGTAASAVSARRADNPAWFEEEVVLEASRAFQKACRPNDLAMAPVRVGFYVGGLSPCRAYSSHGVEPDHARRQSEALAFYGQAAPSWRAALLDAHCVAHVMLPRTGPIPTGWLGEGTPFREAAGVPGAPATAIYSRSGRQGCAP